ncbi:ABC transporter substrate-binding protein [Parapedobacter koreensis]|uniref:Iron complex transport system substrate-binding protein n=1 Tax=Parapedobacter koreensis TaxID=332977 RepID=A0A1H7EX07_9SPHI|nr:ABC transporter substrate-binding protein [Parapedobacter koreensis]SEK18423.1 iron complex transport system substrate-binding protein [Parapedobacter koreensis]
MNRHIKTKWIAVFLGVFGVMQLYAQPITVTDVVGREVTIPAPAKRIILGEGRQLITLGLLVPDPVAIIAGWTGDFAKSGGLLYNEYRKRFPAMDKIPLIGTSGKETVSTEQIIALKPDLAIFGAGSHGPDAKSTDIIRQLEAAGIPIVFIDFRLHPFTNTVPSIEVLGKVLGQEQKAAEFVAFYNRRMNHIQGTLARQNDLKKPKVYMEMIRGGAPPGSPGKGNLGEFIEFVGGNNIGTILPGEVGTLNMEYVISEQPDVYIATGIATPGEPGLVIGQDVYTPQTQQSLAQLAARPVVSPLNAIKQSKVYGMWHLFYDSPLNIAAVEALAKWTHPELFGKLQPHGVLKEINERFLAVPLKGVYFAELKQ